MMNPLSLFKKAQKVKPKSFVVLDFGTATTKAFIFSLDGEARLLGQGFGAAAEAVEQAAAEAGLRPQAAVVVISGPNAWCLTTTVRLTRLDPRRGVEPKEVEGLHQQIFRTALMQATQEISDVFGDPEETLKLSDSNTLFYKIDGQTVSDPLGREGKMLEASIFTTHTPGNYLEKLLPILKELNLELWAVCSLMSATVKALANDNPPDFNAIILDVGGRVTDVAVVFGGGIFGNRPLPLGGELFTAALSKALNLSLKDAEKIKIAYAGGQLKNEEATKIKEKLKDALELWFSGVELALSDFEGIKTLPERIILIGGGAKLKELRQSLSTYPLGRTLPFASPPSIEVRTDADPESIRLIAKDILEQEHAT